MTTIDVAQEADATIRSSVSDTVPFAIAVIPFGMAIGGASAAAGLSAWEALFGGFALLAGASQLAAVETIGAGGGLVATALTVALINMRFVLYGAGIAGWFAEASLRQRMLLAVPVIDQTFILCQERFVDVTDLAARRRYYLTSTAVLASAFLGSQVVAFHVGGTLPDGLGLHLAAPLAFTGMLARSMNGLRDVVAGTVATLVVVAGIGVVGAAALPVGVAAGVGCALTVERRRP